MFLSPSTLPSYTEANNQECYFQEWIQLGKSLGQNENLKSVFIELKERNHYRTYSHRLDLLLPGLFLSKSIKNLAVSSLKEDECDIRSCFNHLKKYLQSSTTLRCLHLHGLKISNIGTWQIVTEGLVASRSLKSLVIQNTSLSRSAFCILAQAMKSKLIKLALRSCSMKAERLDLLISSWIDTGPPNELDLSCNRQIGDRCCTYLTSLPRLPFRIHLSDTSINNRGVEILLHAPKKVRTLTHLHMRKNILGHPACISISNVLRNKTCNLQFLDLSYNPVIDDTCIGFLVNGLTQNHTLHTIELKNNKAITNVGWDQFALLLGHQENIKDTLNANHTLSYIRHENVPSQPILYEILTLNRIAKDAAENWPLPECWPVTLKTGSFFPHTRYRKSLLLGFTKEKLASGLKAIRFHLRDLYQCKSTNLTPDSLSEPILPFLLGWLGRHILPYKVQTTTMNRNSLTAFYDIVRSNPTLMNTKRVIAPSNQKRKYANLSREQVELSQKVLPRAQRPTKRNAKL